MPNKQREINATHQWFTFNMITGLSLLSWHYCWKCSSKPKLNALFVAAQFVFVWWTVSYTFAEVFVFWLEAQRCLFDQTRHTAPLLPVKQTLQLSIWFVALWKQFLVTPFFRFFLHNATISQVFPLFFWFQTFLVWVEVTGILIPWFLSLFEQLFTISTLIHTCSKVQMLLAKASHPMHIIQVNTLLKHLTFNKPKLLFNK